MRKKAMVIVLTLMLLQIGNVTVLTGFTLLKSPSDTDLEPLSSLSYTDHGPISILKDQDFVDQAWPGNGTVGDPYVIDNVNITTVGNCINIENTRKHFRISNSYLEANLHSGAGIRIVNATYATIISCSVQSPYYGVSLVDVVNCTVRDNTIVDSSESGIRLYNCLDVMIDENTVSNAGYHGIHLQSSPNSIINYNDILHSAGSGILIEETSTNCEVTNNIITDAHQNGIVLASADCTASQNQVNSITWSGIVALYSSNSIINGNDVSIVSEYGMWVVGSPHSHIQENHIINTGGISVEDNSDGTLVSENVILNTHWTGLLVMNSVDCIIEDNQIEDVIADGFLAYGGSTNITVDSNIVRRAGWQGLSFDYSPDAKITNNLIEDIDGNGILCTNQSHHSTFSGNTISRTGFNGIDIHQCYNLGIYSNVINDVENTGVGALETNLLIIVDNSIIDSGYCGIEVTDCDSNLQIVGNLVISADYGIIINESPATIMTGNFIRQTAFYSIQIWNSASSHISLNGFIESGFALYSVSVAPGTSWSNGTHGNYWGDYEGEDNNMDGIGDSPYVLDSIHEDPYPLMDLLLVDGFELLSWEPVSIVSFAYEPTNPTENMEITLTLTVDDASKVSEVIFRYSVDNGTTWTTVNFTSDSEVWTATIPPQAADTTVQFEVWVHDISGAWIVTPLESVLIIDQHHESPLNPFTIVSAFLVGTIIFVVAKTVHEVQKRRRLGAWESRM